jgi:hypothetical protein
VRAFLVAIAVLTAFPLAIAQQILNHDSVVTMVKMGLSEDMIVGQINRMPGSFDISPAALAALKDAGVGSKAVAAMVLKGTAPVSSTATAQAMPVPAAPPARDSSDYPTTFTPASKFHGTNRRRSRPETDSAEHPDGWHAHKTPIGSNHLVRERKGWE